jgi:hypothetical protein
MLSVVTPINGRKQLNNIGSRTVISLLLSVEYSII